MDKPTREKLVEIARRMYASGSDDTVQIDATARVSRVEGGGAWVHAWVWVAPIDVEESTQEVRHG